MADYALNELNRHRYAVADEGDYNTFLSGSATFHDVKVISSEQTFGEELLENATMAQRRNAYSPKILSGRRRPGVTLETYICSTGTGVSGSTYAVSSPMGDIVGTMMGGTFISSGSATDGSLASGSFSTDAPLDKFAGSAVGLVNASSGRLEVSRVKSFDTASGDLVLEHALPFTPSNAQTVYGGTHLYFVDDPKNSLQLLVQGQANGDQFNFIGLNGSPTFTWEMDGLAQMSLELEGSNWSFASGTLQEANHTDGAVLPVLDSRVYFYKIPTDTATAGNAVCVATPAWDLQMNLEWIDIPSTCSPTGIVRKRAGRSVPAASGQITLYFDGTDPFEDRTDDTRYGFAIQNGSDPGNTVYFSMPFVQITDVEKGENEGITTLLVSFEALENTISTATAGNIDLARSALSIHLL